VSLGLGLGVIVVLFWWFRLVAPAHEPQIESIDVRHFFFPLYKALFDRAAHGELPLWNPYQLCGLPWLGSPQGGFFYPPHVLFLILPAHTALAALGILHLLLIAWSTALFARRVGLGPAAAMLAAVLFTLRGTIRVWFLAPPLLEACAWLPLGCVAVLDVARRPGARTVAALALVTAASWLAGSPQPTVYLIYGWAALLPMALVAERATASRSALAATAFAVALALGALVAAVQLAPSFEMAMQGTRGAKQLAVAAIFPFGGSGPTLATFVYEQTLGHGRRFSVAALALLVAAPFVHRHRAIAWWAVLFGGAALVLSHVASTPFLGVYLALPALSWFRNPFQLLLLTDFCIAVAAAIVLDSVSGPPEEARGRSLGRWVVFAAAVALAVARTRWHAFVPALVAVGVLFLVALPWRIRRAAALVVVGLATLDMFTAGANTAMLPYDRAAAAEYDTARDVYDRLREAQGTGRAWILRPPFFGAELSPKLASYFQVRALDDYESITLRRQAEYFTYLLEGRTTPANPHFIFAGMLTSGIATAARDHLPARRRLVDLAGVSVLLVPSTMTSLGWVRALVAGSELRPLPSPRPGLVMYENPHAVPRAYVTHHVERAPESRTLLARLSAPGFDPLRTSYVEGGPDLGPQPTDRPGQSARIVRDESEVVEIETPALEAPGLLVLADSFYPGWHATVDGAPAPILPANLLFRGVLLEAGAHRVRFEYRPRSVAIGAAASLVGVLIVAGLLAMSVRGRRRPTTAGEDG